jgi:hypothetical protein
VNQAALHARAYQEERAHRDPKRYSVPKLQVVSARKGVRDFGFGDWGCAANGRRCRNNLSSASRAHRAITQVFNDLMELFGGRLRASTLLARFGCGSAKRQQLEQCGNCVRLLGVSGRFSGARMEDSMWRPAVLKITILTAACAVFGAANLMASSHGSHGSHGGGGHSHGGGSRGVGHSRGGSFHSRGSRGLGGGHSGGVHLGGNRRGYSGGFFSAGRARASGGNFSRGSVGGPGSFSASPYRGGGSARGFSFGSNRSAMGGYSNSRVSSSAGFRSGPGFGGAFTGTGTSRSAASFGANRPPSAQRAAGGWGRGGSTSNYASTGARGFSFGENRPSSAQRSSGNASAMGGQGFARGTQVGRVTSANVNRAGGISPDRASPTRGNFVSGRGIGAGAAMNRASLLGSDRPPYARANGGNVLAGGNSRPTNTLAREMNRSGSNFGATRFGSSSFRNASFSNSNLNSSHFGGRGSSSFGRSGWQGRGVGQNRSGYGGLDRGRFGHEGFRHGGYGYGGYGRGWYGGGDDFWFLGDLFGLALDFGRFAITPWAPLGLVGLDLLNTGIQALGSWDDNNQGSYYDQPGYAPLCGTNYSDENPGCQYP